ncbi:hypothetical protein CY35_10G039800 [Sphagnum magellanicum]|nr:hypothetical protein CY35_10G039800 [Sphagnum magellanicum]
MAAMASVSSTARSLLSPLSVFSRFCESRRGSKRSFKRICPSSSGIAGGVSALGVVVVSATKKRQQSATAVTAATAYLRSYGRRAAMIVLSSAAPAFLLLQQVPIMHGLEFPKSVKDEYDEEEERLVQLFEGATRSVVSVQNVEAETSKVAMKQTVVGEEDVKVEGIGSGFIWDKFGHIVTNYHVVAKLAMDPSGRQKAQVSVLGSDGKITVHEARLIGLDPTRDLAVLKKTDLSLFQWVHLTIFEWDKIVMQLAILMGFNTPLQLGLSVD